jgi:hypothetical protein
MTTESNRVTSSFLASFRGAREAREPGIHDPALGLWVPGSPHPISGFPEIGTIDLHIGYSRCAAAPRSDL